MAELSEGEAEVEGEELEGEYVGEHIRPAAQVAQGPPPESDSKKKKGKRKKAPPPIRINLSACKYEVLRIVQRKLGWKEVGDDDDWEIYWTDTSVSIERIMKLTRIQKINHFSGMLEICRKRAMARNLMKMARQFPQHYDFFPKTFILPGDREEFLADIRTRGKKQVYILKPDAGCQGRGIRLVQGGKEEVVAKVLNEMATPNVVAQHYLSAPLLIHGYKFDLRIYALVLACDPLRVFLFHEGLARICTEKYSPPKASNLDVSFMHLTNYAVNKKNEAFVAATAASADSGEDASKWCLGQLRAYITSLGHDYDKVWGDIADLIIKSLCSVQPILRNNYRSVLPPDNDGFSCFEILGYDVMLDDQLRPWLIEVNHSPSFNIDSPLDLAIKEELITQTIELVRVDPKLIAKTKKAEKRAATSRLLEPMHVKKAPGRVGPGGGGAGQQQQQQQADGKGDGEEGGGGGGGAGGGAGAAGAAGFAKPRTPEEYEAWRSKVLAARERYEAKHMGNFTRIFPSPDPSKQALYEELLKGANDIFQASFQARSKRLDAADEKKRREDAETESQRAERLKAKAHRDKLAQMAVERRKFKLLQQQAQQGHTGPPLLPAYLSPPPQPYLSPSSGSGSGAGPGGLAAGGGGGGGGAGSAAPVYYVPVAPQGPYQYDPSVYQQYYIQQAYLYGAAASGVGVGGAGAGGAAAGQRHSEVYGERSDLGGSAASSRPVSALSNCSGGEGVSCQPLALVPQPPPPIRIYSGPLARAAAAGGAAGQRPGSSTATSGRSSPLAQHPASAGSAVSGALGSGLGTQLQQLQQQLLQTQLQQQGALPPHPFLGHLRRPSSASSRAGEGGGGLEWGPAAAAAAGGVGRTASPSSLTTGAAGGGGGAFGRLGGGGPSGSHSFSYGHGSAAAAAAFQQLQEPHHQGVPGSAAGSGGGGFTQPQPVRPVSVGSAHNHVRHAHSGAAALEAAGVAYSGHSAYHDLLPGEREPPGHSGPGRPGGGGPGSGLFINGSRPPSASAGPASIRDKLQPGGGVGGAAAAALGGAAAAAAARKQSIASAISAGSAAAAATWDAAMAAAAAAAGQDPAAFMQYFNAVRAHPESAGQRLRPTSAAGVHRSPSPLGTVPSAGASPQSGLVGPNGAAAGGGISRAGSGGGRHGNAADMYVLGLTQTLMQQAQQAQQQALAIVATGAGAAAAANGGSPKAGGAGGGPVSTSGAASTPAPSPRLLNGCGGGPWDNGASPAPAAAAAATGGRAYKQSRASPSVAAGYPVLTARSTSAGSQGMGGGGASGSGGGPGSSPAGAPGVTASPPHHTQPQGLGGRPVEDEPSPLLEDDEDEGSPFTYQPLVMPDNNGRHWSATGASPAAIGILSAAASASAGVASAPSSRQRSMTGGVYVTPVAAPVVVTPSISSSGTPGAGGAGAGALAGSPSSLTVRPPVYPPPGGGPGLRGTVAPASGRVGSATAGTAAAAGPGGSAAGGGGGGGKTSGSNSGIPPGIRLASGSLAGGLSGSPAGPSSLAGLAVAGSTIGRGGGAGTLQVGIEGLQITGGGMEADGQMRSAALAALNRKALTVKGRKVAQQ